MFQRTLLTCFLLMFGLSLSAQYTAEKKAQAETDTAARLKSLMKLAEKRHYDGFGKMMAYCGNDPNRNLRTKLNLNDPHEKLTGENTLNKIAHYLKKSALWHMSNFRIVKRFEADLFIWDLEFTLLKGKTKLVKMTFINLKGEYLFCHMS